MRINQLLPAVLALSLPLSEALAANVPGELSVDVRPFLTRNAVPVPPVQAAPARGPAAPRFDGFAGEAIELFFPDLAKGQAPGVVKSKVPSKKVPTDGEMNDEVRLSPLTNPEREAAVKELFRRAGAPSVEQQPLSSLSQNNLVVVKKGKTDRIIVVGGHHDKADVGQGTIDNWTGATMVVNQYMALKDVETKHTYVFVTFGGEESGLVGSGQFVSGLSDEERGKVDAMVNFDTLAVDGTYSWKNGSDRVLLDAAKTAAQSSGYPLKEVTLWGGDADSSSFRNAGMHGMTFFGASPSVIFDVIHSGNDNFGAFSLTHYKNAFNVGLATLRGLD